MAVQKKKIVRASLLMIGTIIGAGVFGVPEMIARAGLVGGSLVFWGVALIVLAIHIFFFEIIARSKTRHRFPGYIKAVLGPTAGHVATLTHSLQLIGALLAYMLIGGEFLSIIMETIGISFPLTFWQMIFWVLAIWMMCFGFRVAMGLAEDFTFGLIILMVFMIVFAALSQNVGIGTLYASHGVLPSVGVFLFAMFGAITIPEIYESTGRNVWITRRGIIYGTLIAALITWLFGFVIALALPPGSHGTVAGLMSFFPSSVRWLLPLAGLLAVGKVFVTLSFDLFATYHIDFHWKRWEAWGLTLGAPVVLLMITRGDFFTTIAVVGSLFTATNGLLIAWAAHVSMRRERKRLPLWWRETIPVAASAVFLVVIVQQVVRFML